MGVGAGFGGGGSGGGEKSNKNFVSPIAGAPGVLRVVQITVSDAVVTNKLKVDVSGTAYTVLHTNRPFWKTSAPPYTAIDPIVFNYTAAIGNPASDRSYSLNPFKVSTNATERSYLEYRTTTGLKNDIKLATSKAKSGNRNLQVLYSSSKASSVSYISGISVNQFLANADGTDGYHSMYVGDASKLTYCFILAQGGGGGGGGADHKYSLFNYAGAGGGGGGGAAVLGCLKLDHRTAFLDICVGKGGAAGYNGNDSSTGAGSSGGVTYAFVYNLPDDGYGTAIYAYGGGGGGRATHNGNHGGGGSGGTFKVDGPGGYLTQICGTNGGGGKGGTGGTGTGINGNFISSYTISTSMLDMVLNPSLPGGSGGKTSGESDAGGGGGASWMNRVKSW